MVVKIYNTAEISNVLVSMLGIDRVQKRPANDADREDRRCGNAEYVDLFISQLQKRR